MDAILLVLYGRGSEVRFRGETGKHLLILSLSAFDPKRSWNRLAAETTIARVDLSTDSGSIGPGR
jgi:hypothetical protein